MNKEERDEALWICGNRAAWTRVLELAIHQLGADDPDWQRARLVAEREAAIATLRRICDEHGDNDWPNELHLADIIEKHLERYL